MTDRDKRRAGIRKTVRGTAAKPRLVVFRSNRFVYAQVIDDSVGKTLASVDKIDDAVKVGDTIAKKTLELGIKEIVFDRAGYKYHGKVKNIAEAARSAGLKF